MKKQTTGNFQTREGLESFVLKSYKDTGQTGKIARMAGVSEHTVATIVKAATAAKSETDDCPDCSVQPSIHVMVGRKHVYQCQECGFVGRAADSQEKAVSGWNHIVRLKAATMRPMMGVANG